MEIEVGVGEYVRTKNRKIRKVKDTVAQYYITDRLNITDNNQFVKEDIVKHSKNIIDLIEVGDIVNNGYIYEIGNTEDGHKWVHNLNGLLLFEEDIETILTHKQYNANCYKVKGE